MTTGTSRVDRFERGTEWPLAVLALVFLAAYAWPILQPGISPAWKHVCTVIDILIWVVFVVEFVARVVRSERRVQYAARHVPDVLMVALPVLRPLRLPRFLVLLRMINRRETASLHGRIVAYVVATAGLVLLVSALAMLEAERHNPQANINTFGDALWWGRDHDEHGRLWRPIPHNHRRSCRRRRVDAGRDRPARCHHRNVRLVADRTSARTETEAQTATRGDIAELRAEIARLTGIVAQRETQSAS